MDETTTTGPSGPDPVGGASPSERRPGSEGGSNLGILLAALLAGAGIIHLVMVPAHSGGSSWIDPIGFALVGWAQLALALVCLLRRGDRTLTIVAVVLNAAVLGLYAWSRTIGLPVGSHAGVVEDVGSVDGISAMLEVGAVVVALSMLAAPARLRIGVLGPSLAAVAVLGLATVAIVSPDAATHGGHDHTSGAADGHDHTTASTDHTAEMAAIDARRCDLGFNPRSYWTEAPEMGVDVYAGGAMAPHASSSLEDLVATPDPIGGRGSPGLDRLISATSEASTGGEVSAAGLIKGLSAASDEDYAAWVRWTGTTARAAGTAAGHAHAASGTTAGASASAVAPDDNGGHGGHGGHAGPQPWKAMVDQKQCVRLSEELEQARETALTHPTAADAMAAGYSRVTPYVPGIAAHYMNFGLVDDEFHIDQPEMILYDGNGPDARVVGLSYYIVMPGQSEPTQGFAGGNDHFHRHVGLCTKAGVGVIGDSTTTPERCRAMGGAKADGQGGWMAHAWVVPGCESPWGVFSGASPLLDPPLATASGTNDGACAASGVRDRYDLRPGGRTPAGSGETAGGD